MPAPAKRKNRFEECESLEEGKKLYRAELMQAHPDQGGSAEAVIAVKQEFDSWVSRRAWEARQSGGTFHGRGGFGGPSGHGRSGYQSRSTDPEDYLSPKTKEKLREVIESGLNCDIEVVGSFIWLANVSNTEVLTLIAWDFTYSKKYDGRWFWADFDYLKANGRLPKGRFNGSYEDMKRLHLNKQMKEKAYLAGPDEED
jgi:hypothetical protein